MITAKCDKSDTKQERSSTNTKKLKYNIKGASNSNFEFPIIHPSKILANNFYDQYVEDKIYSKSLKNRLIWFLKN